MEFISIPVVVAIISLSLYKFFELIVCRSERRSIIEKLPADALLDYLKNAHLGLPLRFNASGPRPLGFPTAALRIGCLMVGIGLGMIASFVLRICFDGRYCGQMTEGGTVLLFGGLFLLIAFFIEWGLVRRQERKK